MKLVIALALGTVIWMLPSASAEPQRITSFSGMAKGQGTLTVDDEKHQLNAVWINLKENGEAEITLFTELQLFAKGRWSAPGDGSKPIALKITGGIVDDSANGAGTLFLRADGKAIDKLTIQGKGRLGRRVTIEFTADKEKS